MSTSQLETPGKRFLSLCLQYALDEGWLSASSLGETFSPTVLMTALESASDLRTKLLIGAAGVHAKIAPKKSTSAAAEDLQIALDEEICTHADVLGMVPVEQMVRLLPSSDLWALLVRDEFWQDNSERAAARMLSMLELALKQNLIDLRGLVHGVTPERMATDLPREMMDKAFTAAVSAGLDDKPFDPEMVLDTLELSSWLEHISVAHFWDSIILAVVAPKAGLTGISKGSTPKTPPSKNEDKPSNEKDLVAKKAAAPADDAKAVSTSGSGKGEAKKGKEKKTQQPTIADKPGAKAAESIPLSEAEKKARTSAIERLTKLDRVPVGVDDLSSPILLGMEAMYAELLKTDDLDERQECVEDAFPNPTMLNDALVALALTIDPKLDEKELRDSGVDTDALIDLVLNDEQRRSKAAAIPPIPGSSLPPPLPPGAAEGKPGIPPPPSKASGPPPPPLPPQARPRPR